MSVASSSAVASSHSDAQNRFKQQQDQIEHQFAGIQAYRREAHNVRREAEQKQRNKETDQQILLLMQTDERLASLLSEAADSMRALLPPSSTADHPTSSSYGAKAFEIKAQQWFSILNEVQYSLRTAVRHLRDSQLAPLTAPAGPDARRSGLAGSAGKGHSISLLEAFVDISNLEGSTFKIPPSKNPPSSLSESQLSLQALRERNRNWKELSRSLEEIARTYPKPSSASARPASSQPQGNPVLNDVLSGSGTDRLLLEALLHTNDSSK